MRKEMALAVSCLLLFGCQQMSMTSQAPLEGKFIDSPRARPLALQPVTNSPWLNNALVDRLAGAADPDEVRGFGKLDLTEQMAQVESEVRWQFWKRFSAVGFAGTGAAWTGFERVDNPNTAVAGGGGFRYELARRYGMHVGLDVAYGPDGAAYYIQWGSAWARP